ncbi:MAG: hypothetical protein ISS28_00540 [Candidatus Cloacimonetes bacterium]|nr:hypothetical protein [Candidatus Cloacimonadota bacterium]
MERKLTLILLLFLLLIFSCSKKTTEAEDWDPYGSYFGPIEDNGWSANFENFNVLPSGFSANATISTMVGYEFFDETIYIFGDVEKNGDDYILSGNFSLHIEDGDGYTIYSSNGSVTGELHYDDDMPFPEGSGSGSTVDNQRTISWNIFKTQ